MPSANGITFHRGRLFIGECREGGRLLEFDLAGGPPSRHSPMNNRPRWNVMPLADGTSSRSTRVRPPATCMRPR
ncbi:hypothetical protein MAHJHV55_54920 [Mycobacterium avium subsp. hominissuis]